MQAYSLVVIFVCYIHEYTSVDIMPELKRNILNFGYGINFKYEGKLSHSFDRFYIATKFILPTIRDLKFLLIEFDSTCNYLNVDLDRKKSQINIFQTSRKLYHSLISIRNKLIIIIKQLVKF